ncbi:alpha/beta hydrolase [Pseudomonas sp. N040]|uniref:alpha/beta hydrolase n=1 Tax=Pseudomonas sp. N040 TaxID=2785325 RepID=UPI0018A28B0E|nr:alpha/beta hydrolase [Pseudomonas sp. N040]MBF7729654.1 alpha/beta hydrolase [Pseudomonas sp. N040]MBW7013296.1 alpha/beta hydrolase [Pseudomonas sp. N040]
MHHATFWLSATDSTPLHVHQWSGTQPPRAIVMLAHGLAEHGARYARLGEALTAHGFDLFALDQRGHGRSAEQGLLGHYADAAGWEKVVGDLASLNHHIRQQHPGLPIFLLGHSMGSYISLAYLMQHSCSLQGAILSGSNFQPASLYRSAGLLARLERWRLGATGRSKLLNYLSFGSFNKAFQPARSGFDWLSRDPVEVDRYVSDPLCGFVATTQLWIDLLGGLQGISSVKQLSQIDPGLPVLLIGGDCDPVSAGRRLNDLAGALRVAGLKDVQLKIYPGARHELLNESNRDEVTADLIHWLEQALAHSRFCQPAPKENP